MSFDNYATHLLQKYTAAIAIAVLKSKPEEVTVESYIHELRNKLDEEKMDANDIDLTICSDDFNEDNDMIFDEEMNDIGDDIDQVNENQMIGNEDVSQETMFHGDDRVGDTQTRYERCARNTSNIDIGKPSQECIKDVSKAISQNIESDIPNQEKNNSCTYICDQMKSATLPISAVSSIKDKNMADLYTNDQLESQSILNNTEMTTAQQDKVVSNAVTDTINLLKEIDRESNTDSLDQIRDAERNCNLSDNSTHCSQDTLYVNYKQNLSLLKEIERKTNKDNIAQTHNIERINNAIDNSTYCSQDTLHVNKKENISLLKETERKTNKDNIAQTHNIEKIYNAKDNSTYCSQDTLYVNNKENSSILKEIDSKTNKENVAQTHSIEIINNAIDNSTYCSPDSLFLNSNVDTQATVLYDLNRELTQNLTHISETQGESDNRFKILEKYVIGTSRKRKIDIEDNAIKTAEASRSKAFNSYNEVADEEDICDDTSQSNSNSVPFKVINELNRIKSLVQRKEKPSSGTESSLESGYRSDSQRRCRLSQSTSDTWLNEAAHSLFGYMMEAKIGGATYSIVHEMSQVLGELIDNLHSQEIYPQFLDRVLEKVVELVGDTIKGDSCGEQAVPIKNETITRLLLLNESLNVNAYTIEKITEELESIHERLTKTEVLYEIADIKEVENTCYIFHVLEVLLKRYLTRNNLAISSQNTIPCSEDRVLPKKSSITHMWKTKWDPMYKREDHKMAAAEKRSVTVKCGEVLKGIIVDCMQGYSLVSYAALQCFNCMQM